MDFCYVKGISDLEVKTLIADASFFARMLLSDRKQDRRLAREQIDKRVLPRLYWAANEDYARDTLTNFADRYSSLLRMMRFDEASRVASRFLEKGICLDISEWDY
ncbi:hypothetical protein HY638_03790 [Candidatus Woesearchaeota archaeon]|nr:hypothetical protein [Candidatus Woesearchaeota archaeon]